MHRRNRRLQLIRTDGALRQRRLQTSADALVDRARDSTSIDPARRAESTRRPDPVRAARRASVSSISASRPGDFPIVRQHRREHRA